MSQLATQLVTAAVVGAVSPLATLGTIAVLTGHRRPLANALCLLAGWTVVLIALAASLRWLLSGADDSVLDDDARAMLNLIVGVLLLSFGLRSMIGARHPLAHVVEGAPPQEEKPPSWLRTLEALTPVRAIGIGALLLLVSPADLLVYLSAIQGISGADLSNGERLLINAALIAAIDICILVPVGIYIAMPRRAASVLASLRTWLIANQHNVVAGVLLFFAVVQISSGVSHFL